MSITISTNDGFSSYDYDHNVWIDFNDDFVFDSTELVASGITPATSPTTLTLNFTPSATVSLGVHRMRIANADSGQNPPNACYNGNYGNTIDLNVNLVAPTCQPVTYSSATVVADCANNEFSVEVVVTGLGDATTPSLTDGVNSWAITAAGTVTAGPYASGSSNTLTITHQDNTCIVNLGSFTTNCPPLNNDCTGAIVLTPGGTFDTNPLDGTILAATTTAGITPSCQASFGFDVWYSVVVPASGELTIETQGSAANSMTDSVIAVFSGTCGALTEVDCDDDAGTGNMSLLSLTGLTEGETLYIGVWKWGTTAPTVADSGFRISAYDGSLGNNSFDNSTFTYYPNPVKNVLNLSYNQNISQVEVYNIVGQKMSTNSFNENSVQIDMSKYPTGVYLVNITSNNTTKTVRVIKE